ncbi:hypothetical protein BcDW1_9368 [Botrytis cinerea BcDW1]|nr:hypothetical protein BcDW1_9368 [Botrytis cinerea BcDW1]
MLRNDAAFVEPGLASLPSQRQPFHSQRLLVSVFINQSHQSTLSINTMSNQGYYNNQPQYGGQPQYPPNAYGGPPPQQGYYQQGPPPQQMQYEQQPPPKSSGGGGGCLGACFAALCCCCVMEEGCELCVECAECC